MKKAHRIKCLSFALLSCVFAIAMSSQAASFDQTANDWVKKTNSYKSVDDFVKTAYPKPSDREFVQEFIKSNRINKLPKASYKDGIFTLTEDTKKIEVKVIDIEPGVVEINGYKVILHSPEFKQKTIQQRFQYYARIFKRNPSKQSWMQLFVPNAMAEDPYASFQSLGDDLMRQIGSASAAENLRQVGFNTVTRDGYAGISGKAIHKITISCESESVAEFGESCIKNESVVRSNSTANARVARASIQVRDQGNSTEFRREFFVVQGSVENSNIDRLYHFTDLSKNNEPLSRRCKEPTGAFETFHFGPNKQGIAGKGLANGPIDPAVAKKIRDAIVTCCDQGKSFKDKAFNKVGMMTKCEQDLNDPTKDTGQKSMSAEIDRGAK